MTLRGPEPVDRSTAPDAPSPDRAPVLDEAAIAELDGEHGAETTDQIIALFAAELDQRVASLATIAGIGAVTRDVHALASAARSVGCLELACLCRETETVLRTGDADLAGRVSRILVAADRARRAIATAQSLRAR
jgi:HPt (histidine-containing phosphotransfer) domain-containing protein